ncbi:hypothetical protein [Novosphingobium sp. AP12]|uniref:hypothetical protein n=1 Tax=Novosphingobium sp. AP12 TaxID=1144305 RepID=UPI000271EC3D|nr:hypothetical protein [Novosphingobium sp. AP12]EJL33192.1 hypothetical protein PMI02_01227 [Novosphingobium sp. AP12]
MLKHADPILKIALALAALLAGAGVGYYYGIYLPAQDVRRQTQEMAARRTQEQAETKALAERARREQAAQTEYQDCANFAELSYKQRWNLSCQSLHDADEAVFEDCADDLFSTRDGCLAKHPIRPAQGCALPAQVAQSLSQARDERKAQCLARLEAVQQGRSPAPIDDAPMTGPSGLN